LIASGSKFIEISILAMIGLLFKNGLSRNVNYRHLWILSVYSVTITTIFFTVMDALQTTVPLDFYINWIVNMFILYLAIKEIPSNKKSIH
jgi:chromate transport protein ChrA